MNRSLNVTLTAAALLATGFATAEETTRPNILMILCDDMGYGDVTCNGPGIGVPTPRIDKLASEGIRFTQGYVTTPICSPSRAGILTGRYPGRVGLNTFLHTREHNIRFQQADFLDPSIPTLPRLLKSAGYATGHFGKWHLGGGRDVKNAPTIPTYGYDEFVSTWESPQPDPKLGVYTPWEHRPEPEQLPRFQRTAYVMDRTIDFMSRHRSKPWFVTLWNEDVHSPWQPSPALVTKYGGRNEENETMENLKGVVEEYDRQVGRLLDNITSMGLAENTVVIFLSDNGPFPKLEVRTGGLRGRKASLYEGGIRVPFIVRWPKVAPAGMVNSTTVMSSLDLFPTLANIAGVRIPAEVAKELDGVNMSAAFRGETPKRAKLHFWDFGRMTKPDASNNEVSPQVAVRDGDWKLLVNPTGPRRELFNLADDPNEKTNVAAQHPEISDRLTSAARAWRQTLPVILRDPMTSHTYVKDSRR